MGFGNKALSPKDVRIHSGYVICLMSHRLSWIKVCKWLGICQKQFKTQHFQEVFGGNQLLPLGQLAAVAPKLWHVSLCAHAPLGACCSSFQGWLRRCSLRIQRTTWRLVLPSWWSQWCKRTPSNLSRCQNHRWSTTKKVSAKWNPFKLQKQNHAMELHNKFHIDATWMCAKDC